MAATIVKHAGIAAAAAIFSVVALIQGAASDFGGDYDPAAQVSVFIFRDVNRNGRYDLGDRPFAGVEVGLSGPQGHADYSSNMSGFANHRFNVEGRGDRRAVGAYELRAHAPAGFLITTGNGEQAFEFVAEENSPVGIVMDLPPRPIGIAPELSVSGRAACLGGSLEITAPSGKNASVTLSADGSFDFPAGQGAWVLSCEGEDGKRVSRTVTVDALPVHVAGLDRVRIVGSGRPPVTPVTFDDLVDTGTLMEVPNGYRGLDWWNFVATHNQLYGGAGYVNATTSGAYVAYTSGGYPSAISRSEPFDAIGLDLATAWPEGEAHDIVLRGMDGETVLYEERIRASSFGALHVDLGYYGITELQVIPGAYWQAVIDGLVVALD
jgi:hypothetical protein